MAVKLRKRAMKKKGHYSLYLDIVSDGIREREFIGLRLTGDRGKDKETMAMAKNLAAKREVDLLNDELKIKSKLKAQMKLITYFEDMVLRDFPDSKNHNSTLSKLKAFSQSDVFLSKITLKWGTDFRDFLTAHHKPNTAGLYFRILSQILSLAVQDGYVRENQLAKVEAISRQETQKDFLTIDELKVLAKTPLPAHPEVKLGFLFSCFTGLRYSDVSRIKWQDIHNNQIEFRQKKTKELNYVPMSKAAQRLLDEVRKNDFQSPYIFPLPCNVTTNQNLKNWAAQAGLAKHITFHTSRHTFAVLSLTQGVGIYTVKELLGHKDFKSTEVYGKVIDKLKQDAVKSLPDLDF